MHDLGGSNSPEASRAAAPSRVSAGGWERNQGNPPSLPLMRVSAGVWEGIKVIDINACLFSL